MAHQPASDSPRYRNWVAERDKALERLLIRSQSASSDFMRSVLYDVVKTISHRYRQIPPHGFFGAHAGGAMKGIEEEIDRHFTQAAQILAGIFKRMRRTTYTLAYTGEVEGIGRTLGKRMHVHLSRSRSDELQRAPSPSGGPVQGRIESALLRLRNDILSALASARVRELDVDDALLLVQREFPRTLRYKRPPRILKKPLQESEDEDDDEAKRALAVVVGPQKPWQDSSVAVGEVDPEAWDDVVNDYTNKYIPQFRGPEYEFDSLALPIKDGEEEWFGWQIEKEMTQDFVEQVRSGQVQAANDQGINDFVWISIIDDKTDECCNWRNGLTSIEIEAQLDGPRKDDDCDAIVPPAHFNCRCTLAPMLEDMPEESPPDFGAFETWLNAA